jgi:hypothetical protein
MMVVTIVVRDNVVASEVDGMCAGYLKEDAFVLGNSDVKGLLVVLIDIS